MLRIAIVGSCITRDLWPIRGGGSEQLLYISRTSLPSLFAPPLAGFRPSRTLPGDLHRHEHNALVADLQKTTLGRLVAFQPTHLILDFIDERFDLISTRAGMATYSAELVRSGYLSQPAFRGARPVSRLSPAGDRLWLEAAGAFAALVRATELGRAGLILHSARWATHQRSPDGEIAPVRGAEIIGGQPADVVAYNHLLEHQEAALTRLMPPMTRIAAPALRLADPGHQWGLSRFHYVPEYYEEVRRQLASAGLAEAFTDLDASPNVQAA